MEKFLQEASNQNHPLRVLKDFLDKEQSLEKAKLHDQRRFVGYVLNIGFGEVTIITCDPFKVAVGGIPRNSLLIMCPSSFESDDVAIPPHFTLLRVLDTAPTPLSFEVQQTYFELQKKSMPELDVFTQSELQWGALKTSVLGMFYPHPEKANTIEFSGDVNNYVSAHKYRVFSPDDALLDLVNNALVPIEHRFQIGKLRLTECRLPLPNKKLPDVKIFLSTNDFMGSRTAMFGKTRLGKSNVVKLIAQSLIETTATTKNVGQLIFDINGEYANDNPQDDSSSLKSAYSSRCQVYALTKKEHTDSKPLRLDFYENPESSHRIIGTLLKEAGKDSIYINSFLSVDIPSIESIKDLPPGDNDRAKRKILMYWAILHRAGYAANVEKLKGLLGIDPHFNQGVRCAIYNVDDIKKCPHIDSLDMLANEIELCAKADRVTKLKSSSGKDLFDADDTALLGFLKPISLISAGPKIIQEFRKYHDPHAGDFVKDIIALLDEGQTVIIDLGNAAPEVTNYFSVYLSKAIFRNQVDKFSNNKLGGHYLQLFFEEAHNLFPTKEEDEVDIYRRIAKEGAKYHIGMVYSTQSPTTISPDLLAQTENFFIAHLASQDDVNRLAKLNVAYESLKDDILQAKTVGYIRMLTRSHRFVVSMQALRFTPPQKVN
jgi:hypothetical protein